MDICAIFYSISGNGESVDSTASYIVIEKQWIEKSELVLTFVTTPEIKDHCEQTFAVRYGPLLFALPLQYTETSGRQYPVEGYVDQFFKGNDDAKRSWQLLPDSQFQSLPDNNLKSWASPPRLSGLLYDPVTLQKKTVELIPMGCTVLRKVSFELAQMN